MLLPITPTLLPEVSPPPTGLETTRGSTEDCVNPRPNTPDPEPKRVEQPRLPLAATDVTTPLELVLLTFVPDNMLLTAPAEAACA